ncbi:MAG TPA: hypothetical protein VGX68_04385 [Thermoanaerobaculia bacterium]|nr:hypothetical protein [Thermoanaerobaculia bacterium]
MYSCRPRAGARFLSGLLFMALSLSGSSLIAQEEASEEKSSELKVTFHGYLTQAYARSDGHNFLGITEDGTADYRTAALQVRADIRKNDAFVVQFSHERLGESGAQEIKDDVELDWIFYEHRFGDSAVKVGRVQIPFGIYNEVRDVGTLLPFYRPSNNFYGEAAYSSETVDGVVLSHSFRLGDWGLDADLHYGDWKFVSRDFFTGKFVSNDVNDSIGAELWLDTPISGLRFGAGGMRYDIDFAGVESKWDVYHVSVAGDFDRFAVHSEYKDVNIGSGFHVLFDYIHLGVNLTDKVTLNAQQDRFFTKLRGTSKVEADKDRAVGVNYAFNPSLILKTEHHWDEGRFWLEDVPQFGPPGLKTRYWLISLSTSF